MIQPAQQPHLIDLSELTSDEDQPLIHVPQVAVAPRLQHAEPKVAVALRVQHAEPRLQPRMQHAERMRGCKVPLAGWLGCLILAWTLFHWLTVLPTLSLLPKQL